MHGALSAASYRSAGAASGRRFVAESWALVANRGSTGPLHGGGVFAGAERNGGALASEGEAFEEIAHGLAEAVMTQGIELDLIHKLTPEGRGLIANRHDPGRRWVLLGLIVRVQQFDEADGGGAGGSARMSFPMQESHEAARNAPGVGQVEGNVEEGRRFHGPKLIAKLGRVQR
jgi:hypothetical protein